MRTLFIILFLIWTSALGSPISVPGKPSGSAIVENRLYVNNTAAPFSINIINTASYEMIATLPTLEYPIYSSVANGKVGVLNFDTDTISIIDGHSNQQIGTVDLKGFPLDDIAPYYSAAYANKIISTDWHKNSVSISNLLLLPPFATSHAPVEAVIQVGDNAIYPYVVGNKFFVNALNNGYVVIIDAKTNQKIATLYVPGSFGMRASVIRGDKIYIAVAGSNIKIIDTRLINYSLNPNTLQTAPVVGQINAPLSAIPMYIMGKYLVGTNLETNGTIYIVNLDSGQIYSYPIGQYGLIVGAKGNQVYTASPYDNQIKVFNLANIDLNQPFFVKTITGDGSPNSGAVYLDKLFICNFNHQAISVLDTKTDTLIDTSLPQLLSFTHE